MQFCSSSTMLTLMLSSLRLQAPWCQEHTIIEFATCIRSLRKKLRTVADGPQSLPTFPSHLHRASQWHPVPFAVRPCPCFNLPHARSRGVRLAAALPCACSRLDLARNCSSLAQTVRKRCDAIIALEALCNIGPPFSFVLIRTDPLATQVHKAWRHLTAPRQQQCVWQGPAPASLAPGALLRSLQPTSTSCSRRRQD